MPDYSQEYNHQSTSLLLFIPVMLGVAILLAFVELFTHRHRGHSFCADLEAAEGTRVPLLRRNRRPAEKIKGKARWWQFWRKTRGTVSDSAPSQSFDRPLNSVVLRYGAIHGIHGLQISAYQKNTKFARYPYKLVPNKIITDPTAISPEYELVRTLKHSNEGPLHLVRHRQTQQLRILKQLPCQSTKARKPRWPIEAEIMSKLSHPNVIRLHEVTVEFPIANIVMDFCQQGDLMNYMAAVKFRDGQIPAPFVMHFISTMLDALSYVHSEPHKILHRDIKPQNIFLRTDEQSIFGMPTPVLADFGLARSQSDNLGLPGTDRYMAPELLALRNDPSSWAEGTDIWDQTGHHTPGTDMYGFAASLLELLALDTDMARTPYDIVTIWESSTVSDRPEVLNLLLDCLSDDSDRRPSADALQIMSMHFKQELQEWYNAGGRIPATEFPEAWEFDDGENDKSGTRSKSEFRTYTPIANRCAATRWPPLSS
ncbi:Serine/threonine-protein kinase Nek8 [Pseudocercospora fuligena]|uniref:non-specific serine/threonine protein kinase n=1 Tax=Pseudocercospora fuligena TaxID=685502 RepID=A0A8H6VKE3_9PEZI|nr:Serine/threonine-protein kinase Nek8 [Pseudocercospora fuligena]